MKVLWDYHANKEVSLKIQAQRIQIHTFYSLHRNVFQVQFPLNGPLKNFFFFPFSL